MARLLAATLGIAVASASPATAQEIVKIGQLEAHTGPAAGYTYMMIKGVPMAVDEINKAGGFKVGNKTFKLELVSPDTRADPREATVLIKKMLEQEKVQFVFGATTSNVFATIFPYMQEMDNKFLLFTTASRAHEQLGTPKTNFLIRTWNWVGGPDGTADAVTRYVKEKMGAKKVAILLPNNEGGRVTLPAITESLDRHQIPWVNEYFDPASKDYTPQLAKLAAAGADILSPGVGSEEATITDLIRQAAEGGYFKRFVGYNGGLLNPGLRNKDIIDDYVFDSGKYFPLAEQKEPRVKKFIEDYKARYKEDFPYSQAANCGSACYDHVFMLVQAMQRAGTVTDLDKIKKEFISKPYEGLWTISYTTQGEQRHAFQIVHIKHGGAIDTFTVDPQKN